MRTRLAIRLRRARVGCSLPSAWASVQPTASYSIFHFLVLPRTAMNPTMARRIPITPPKSFSAGSNRNTIADTMTRANERTTPSRKTPASMVKTNSLLTGRIDENASLQPNVDRTGSGPVLPISTPGAKDSSLPFKIGRLWPRRRLIGETPRQPGGLAQMKSRAVGY
jgi:hypothetical protein